MGFYRQILSILIPISLLSLGAEAHYGTSLEGVLTLGLSTVRQNNRSQTLLAVGNSFEQEMQRIEDNYNANVASIGNTISFSQLNGSHYANFITGAVTTGLEIANGGGLVTSVASSTANFINGTIQLHYEQLDQAKQERIQEITDLRLRTLQGSTESIENRITELTAEIGSIDTAIARVNSTLNSRIQNIQTSQSELTSSVGALNSLLTQQNHAGSSQIVSMERMIYSMLPIDEQRQMLLNSGGRIFPGPRLAEEMRVVETKIRHRNLMREINLFAQDAQSISTIIGSVPGIPASLRQSASDIARLSGSASQMVSQYVSNDYFGMAATAVGLFGGRNTDAASQNHRQVMSALNQIQNQLRDVIQRQIQIQRTLVILDLTIRELHLETMDYLREIRADVRRVERITTQAVLNNENECDIFLYELEQHLNNPQVSARSLAILNFNLDSDIAFLQSKINSITACEQGFRIHLKSRAVPELFFSELTRDIKPDLFIPLINVNGHRNFELQGWTNADSALALISAKNLSELNKKSELSTITSGNTEASRLFQQSIETTSDAAIRLSSVSNIVAEKEFNPSLLDWYSSLVLKTAYILDRKINYASYEEPPGLDYAKRTLKLIEAALIQQRLKDGDLFLPTLYKLFFQTETTEETQHYRRKALKVLRAPEYEVLANNFALYILQKEFSLPNANNLGATQYNWARTGSQLSVMLSNMTHRELLQTGPIKIAYERSQWVIKYFDLENSRAAPKILELPPSLFVDYFKGPAQANLDRQRQLLIAHIATYKTTSQMSAEQLQLLTAP